MWGCLNARTSYHLGIAEGARHVNSDVTIQAVKGGESASGHWVQPKGKSRLEYVSE